MDSIWNKTEYFSGSFTFKCRDMTLLKEYQNFSGFDITQTLFSFGCFYLDQYQKAFNNEDSLLENSIRTDLRKKAMNLIKIPTFFY